MARLRTVIQIGADGSAAAREISGLKSDTDALDESASGVSFDNAAESAANLPGPLGEAGALLSGPGGMVAAGGALALALFEAANAAIEVGKTAEEISLTLDTTVEEGSRLAEVFQDAGLEGKDVIEVALQITDSLAGAPELAEKLGLNLDQAISPMEALQAGFDNWDLLTPTERIKAFGEEGVRQVAAVKRLGGDLQSLLDGISGARVIDDAELAKLKETEDTMREISALVDGIKTTVGVEVVKSFEDWKRIAEGVGNVLDEVIGPWADLFGASTEGVDLLGIALQGAGSSAVELYDIIFAGTDNSISGTADLTTSIAQIGETAATAGGTATTEFGKVATAIDGATTATELANQALNDWKDDLTLEAKGDAMLTKLGEVRDGAVEEFGAAEQATIEWLSELDNVPYEQLKAIQVAFAEGDIEAVLTELNRVTVPRNVRIGLEYYNAGGYNSGPGSRPNEPGTLTNVNITMAGQPSSRELSNMVSSWTRNS